MSACSRCESSYPEYELTWIKIASKHPIQIIWTGRGRDPRQEEKKMELVCDDCIKEYSATSLSSLSS